MRRRGIYLISTLLLLTFLLILGGALMVSFQQGLASSSAFNNRQLALQAALSGLQYVQARLEASATTYSPSATPTPAVFSTADGSFQVMESPTAFNICGYLTNANVASSSEPQVRVMFRAAFNPSYTAFDNTVASNWGFVNFAGTSWSLPPIGYLSMNNLNRGRGRDASSYDAGGTPLQAVPASYADLIVEGLCVGPGGNVLARRTVESMVMVAGSGGITGASSSARDTDLLVDAQHCAVTVAVADSMAPYAANAGLSSLANINVTGQDAAPSDATSPPDYNSSARANLQSTTGNHFSYTANGTTTDFTSQVAQQHTVNPAAISASSLPPLRSGSLSVNAGLWVVWNGALYHYAVDYNPVDSSGNPIPLTHQPWTQGAPDSPPLYNGVSTDSPNGGVVRIDSDGRQSTPFNPDNNTVTLDSADANVTPMAAASSATVATVNSFALVTAPNGTVTYTDSAGQTQTSTIVNSSAAKGSAQLQLSVPAGGDQGPQFRSPGTVTVVGNVVGTGALVTTGQSGNSTVAGDINIVGKSALDSRDDSGVAMYAAGSLNVWELTQAQAPAAVPAVSTAMTNANITPGSGDTTVTSSTTTVAVNAGTININGTTYTGPTTISFTGSSPPTLVIGSTSGNNIDASISISGDVGAGSSINCHDHSAIAVTVSATNTQNFAVTAHDHNSLTFNGNINVSGTIHDHDAVSGTGSGSLRSGGHDSTLLTGTGTATSSASPDPSASPTSSVTPVTGSSASALDVSFTGLVYAQQNVKIVNRLGNVQVTGAMIAYGGDPATQAPGASGNGKIHLQGNSILLTYDPTVLAAASGYLGGRVLLMRTCLTLF